MLINKDSETPVVSGSTFEVKPHLYFVGTLWEFKAAIDKEGLIDPTYGMSLYAKGISNPRPCDVLMFPKDHPGSLDIAIVHPNTTIATWDEQSVIFWKVSCDIVGGANFD